MDGPHNPATEIVKKPAIFELAEQPPVGSEKQGDKYISRHDFLLGGQKGLLWKTGTVRTHVAGQGHAFSVRVNGRQRCGLRQVAILSSMQDFFLYGKLHFRNDRLH